MFVQLRKTNCHHIITVFGPHHRSANLNEVPEPELCIEAVPVCLVPRSQLNLQGQLNFAMRRMQK